MDGIRSVIPYRQGARTRTLPRSAVLKGRRKAQKNPSLSTSLSSHVSSSLSINKTMGSGEPTARSTRFKSTAARCGMSLVTIATSK